MLSEKELLSHALKFGFGGDEFRPKYCIEFRNTDQWAITDYGECYDSQLGGFRREPIPSSRTYKFMKTTRFSLEEAVNIVEKLLEVIPKVKIETKLFVKCPECKTNNELDYPTNISCKYCGQEIEPITPEKETQIDYSRFLHIDLNEPLKISIPSLKIDTTLSDGDICIKNDIDRFTTELCFGKLIREKR